MLPRCSAANACLVLMQTFMQRVQNAVGAALKLIVYTVLLLCRAANACFVLMQTFLQRVQNAISAALNLIVYTALMQPHMTKQFW